jgi:hypothetical protein
MSEDNRKKSADLLKPMLDVFGGADGGGAFVKLQHKFLPDILEMADQGEPTAQAAVLMVERFSKLCAEMLKSVDRQFDL